MKYEAKLYQIHPTKWVPVDATDEKEAYRLAKEQNPGWYVELVRQTEDFGKRTLRLVEHECELCMEPIFDGDDYGVTEDENHVCPKCMENPMRTESKKK